jgi:PadR family transcriptional regulator, regulatory protein PadR
MSRNPVDYLHGTLETLILKTLYPALYRMEKRGWVEAEWGVSELGRRAKLYRLTRTGRAQLAHDTEAWQTFAAAVTRVLVKA